ncbi:hypothetical protein CKO28_17520 [Rhodovibrio sodomensis]|uniref:Uncharacterized protein n=1 Tax=Rhodovibrio sodomensis TaxID=1088 RepID=A0ABS1DHS5_9PROT|nr:hypothetical protein [Rhodovibrio sodomensis]MBK1669838.1 hypothetical protein [Rhodovibrio sodomensis]
MTRIRPETVTLEVFFRPRREGEISASADPDVRKREAGWCRRMGMSALVGAPGCWLRGREATAHVEVVGVSDADAEPPFGSATVEEDKEAVRVSLRLVLPGDAYRDLADHWRDAWDADRTAAKLSVSVSDAVQEPEDDEEEGDRTEGWRFQVGSFRVSGAYTSDNAPSRHRTTESGEKYGPVTFDEDPFCQFDRSDSA